MQVVLVVRHHMVRIMGGDETVRSIELSGCSIPSVWDFYTFGLDLKNARLFFLRRHPRLGLILASIF